MKIRGEIAAVFLTAWLAVNGWQLIEIINLKIAVAQIETRAENKTNEKQNPSPVVTTASRP